MRKTQVFFACHLAALAFGLAGILIAMPHPELWAGHPALVNVYTFGLQHGGATHIIFGTITMILFGIWALGWRKTLIFAAVGTLIPLGAELLGTGTGWPFGGYSYTDYLGVKVAGRVPYSVPLSWFYMGFASYLLAMLIMRMLVARPRAWQTVGLGAWLLTAWDLVLDPAMASDQLQQHTGLLFWVWHEHGAYFGMPLRNLVGWFGTAVLFIAVSRALWSLTGSAEEWKAGAARWDEAGHTVRLPIWLPLGIYLANLLWAMALALSVGLWQTAIFAVVLGILPASLAWRAPRGGRHAPAVGGFNVADA